MPIALPVAIATHIAETEAAIGPFDESAYVAALDALVPDAAALSPDERRGCFAEISAHRFVLLAKADSGPWGIAFGPQGTRRYQDGTLSHGPDAQAVDRETIEYWAARSEASPHPALRARYADLSREMTLFWNKSQSKASRLKPSRELGKRAARAYLDIVEQGLSESESYAWIYLARAVKIALWIQDADLCAQAKDAMFAYNRARRADGGVGPWWIIDNVMWDNKGLDLSTTESVELFAWLNGALDGYVDSSDLQRFDPHQALDAAQALMRRHGDGGRDLGVASLKKAGAAFESMAAKAHPMLAAAWMQSMSLSYRAAGLVEDANRVDLSILARARALSEPKARAVPVPGLPPDTLPEEDAEMIKLLMGDSAGGCLGLIAEHLMAPEALLRSAEEEEARSPGILDYIPIEKISHDGFTTATIGSSETDIGGRMIYFAALFMEKRSPELDGAFKAAIEKWGIDAAGLMNHIAQSPLFLQRSRDLLQAGIDAWFSGDDMKAIHILVPQVEAAAREIMIMAGESPMTWSEAEGGFKSKGLGEILVSPAFRENIDATLRLHLRALYTSPKGHNLRNEIAHGLATASVFGRGLANWVIHSLLAIRHLGMPPERLPTVGADTAAAG